MLKEYIISYQAGTSPYWYNVSIYAENEAEAKYRFITRSDLCPDNVKAIKIIKSISI